MVSVPKARSKRGRPATGVALTPAERMRRLRAPRKSAGLKAVVTWEPRASSVVRAPYSAHRLLEARSLAMHALIAAKIMRDPKLLSKARDNIERWSVRFGKKPPRWIGEWRRILTLSYREITAIITEPSEEGARLRQSSPFAGVLTPEERRRIYEAFRA